MELSNLYSQINNPINDISVIQKIVDVYAMQDKGFGGFYGRLVKTVDKNNSGKYRIDDADKFVSMMFNKWKKSIVDMTKEEFIALRCYGADFVKMRKYLLHVPDVKTAKEVRDIIWKERDDKELQRALEKYRWDAFGEGSSWNHVCSRYVTARKDSYPNIEHRLYLNTDSLDTYKLVTLLVEKCNEHKVPYYFKFDECGNRDDTVVIYSSTENLGEYIDILREIKKENPDLGARFMAPPLLTGKIDGWIGYGSEPAKLPNGKNTSFNEVRTKLLEPIVDKYVKKWVMDHKGAKIKYQGALISFQEYFARIVVEEFISKLEQHYSYSVNTEQILSQRENRSYNENNVINRMGYSLNEIRSINFKQRVFNQVNSQIGDILIKICMGESLPSFSFSFNNGKNKDVKLSSGDFREVFHKTASKIVRNDANFAKNIQKEIKDSCNKYGIDKDKFCFDIAARKKIEQFNSLHNDVKKEEVIEERVMEDELSELLTADMVKDMLNKNLREYYTKVGSLQVLNENKSNFNMRIDYVVDEYFGKSVTGIIEEYVSGITKISNMELFDELIDGLLDKYEELVISLKDYIKPLFLNNSISEIYMNSFLDDLRDKGIDYLSLVFQSILDDALGANQPMSPHVG